MRVLVTGAAGFVGRALVPVLTEAGHEVFFTSRDPGAHLPGATPRPAGPLGPDSDWTAALGGIEAVVHLAARVHVMDETAADPLAEFRRVNALGTRRLAEQAAAAGVRRLVFLSTLKVLGEATVPTAPFSDATPPRPADPYAISKLEAERAVFAAAETSAMQAVVLRPPLVYGPGVGGNFLSLLRLCAKGWPLPLGAVANRRSLIHVGNLASAIASALVHPAAPGKAWLVDDGAAVSTPQLIGAICRALGREPRLIPVPPALLRLAGALTGRGGAVSRLCGSLEVDASQFRRDLGWTPPFSMLQGLEQTAAWLVQRESGAMQSEQGPGPA